MELAARTVLMAMHRQDRASFLSVNGARPLGGVSDQQ